MAMDGRLGYAVSVEVEWSFEIRWSVYIDPICSFTCKLDPMGTEQRDT